MTYRVWSLTSPSGDKFFAAVVPWKDGVRVLSTRDGKWAPEEKITVADLVMPEQEYLEWDVRSVERNEAPSIPDELMEDDDGERSGEA